MTRAAQTPSKLPLPRTCSTGQSTPRASAYTVLVSNRRVLPAAIVAALFSVTAFTVPLVAPLRASSAHLVLAAAVILVGAGLAFLILAPNLSTPDATEQS